MSTTGPVHYQEHDGRDGLTIEHGRIVAYRDGAAAAKAPAPAGAQLRQLMLNYQVIGLLPAIEFCHTTPASFQLEIELDQFHLPDELTGKVTINGDKQMWVARYTRHPDFRNADQVPDAHQPYISDDGRGFEYLLPGVIQTHPDKLVARRLACALDRFLCAVVTGRPFAMPYRAQFTNVFSAADPAWRINLPRVISLDERAAQELI